MPRLAETLAELSRERRKMRAEGVTERYAIWFQTGQKPYTYYSVEMRDVVPQKTPKRVVVLPIKGPAEKPPGPFSHMPRMGANTLRREVAMLSAIQNDRCYLCSRRFGDGWARATFDHVTPFSQCGVNGGNGLAACAMCNNEKGDRMPTQAELRMLAIVNVTREKMMNVMRSRGKKCKEAAWVETVDEGLAL